MRVPVCPFNCRMCCETRFVSYLRPLEYLNLKSHLSSIEKAVPQLETIEPCFLQDDHQNQLGMLRCAMCNPLEYQNW